MNAPDHRELDWIAFRYAAGERAGPEFAEFEAQLASDEAAQRSLCEAVELGMAISAALASADHAVSAPRASRRRLSLPFAAAAVLAASLLVAYVSWALVRGGLAGPQVGGRETPAEDPFQLAIIWSQARQTSWNAELDEWDDSPWVEADGAMGVDSEWPSAEVPEWLLAAVTAAEEVADEDGQGDLGET